MKYIDAEKLKAEIEKHIKEVKDAADRFTLNMEFVDAKLSGIYDAMSIVDSLQQEQPEVDLEKILELLEKHLELFTAGNLDRRKGYTKHDMQDAFILGFKAGIKRR